MQVQLEEGENIDMKTTEPTIPLGLGNHSAGGNNSFSIGNSLQSVTGNFPSNESYRSFFGGYHKLPWEDQDYFYNLSIAGYYNCCYLDE
ncbi:MAG: hypothetical protein QXH89_00995, partial [Candidatus Anstonellales archaeon]